MRTAIYPGSFDPVTNGHLNIIRRAAKSFDRLVVCVMYNVDKHPMFTAQERVELIRRVTADIPILPGMRAAPSSSRASAPCRILNGNFKWPWSITS